MIEPTIKLNPAATIRIHSIGGAGQCVIVDDFLENPHEWVDYAAASAEQFAVPPKSYPGHVLPVKPKSAREVERFIKSSMSRNFEFLRGGLGLTTLLSMTTLRPDELSNLQRLCHSDPKTSPKRQNFAALIYLFEDEELGGTGFYRWKERDLIVEATALEQQDPDKALEFLKDHFPTYGKAPCYLTETNEIAELIDVVPARFNRWVFYSGNIPHSAYIAKPELLSKDYRKGRLTLNFFASVVPR